MSNYLQDFQNHGYAIVSAENTEALNTLRREIFQRAKRVFDHSGDDIEDFFNNFHKLDITGARLNELRMKLISEVNDSVDSGSLIFEAFKGTVLGLLGPDLLVQKNTNLVIQQPNDPNPSELHRDAPANSPFEIVVWLPLVDCYSTKAMYVLDKEKTDEALKFLDEGGGGFNAFESFAKTQAPNVAVPYGSALFFWTALLHGSHVNSERETRWSLNMRFKNLFSPNGDKEPFEFFKVFQLSPLTKMATDFLKEKELR